MPANPKSSGGVETAAPAGAGVRDRGPAPEIVGSHADGWRPVDPSLRSESCDANGLGCYEHVHGGALGLAADDPRATQWIQVRGCRPSLGAAIGTHPGQATILPLEEQSRGEIFTVTGQVLVALT